MELVDSSGNIDRRRVELLVHFARAGAVSNDDNADGRTSARRPKSKWQ